MLDLAVDGIPVAVACRVLGFSKQAFFKWRKNPVPQRDWDDAHLTNAATSVDETWIAIELGEQGPGITLSAETMRRVLPELSELLDRL